MTKSINHYFLWSSTSCSGGAPRHVLASTSIAKELYKIKCVDTYLLIYYTSAIGDKYLTPFDIQLSMVTNIPNCPV